MADDAMLDIERDRQRARVLDGLDSLIEVAKLLCDDQMQAVLVDAKQRIRERLSAESSAEQRH